MQSEEQELVQTKPEEEQFLLMPGLGQLRAAWWVWLLGLLLVGSATSLFLWLANEVLEKDVFVWDARIMLAVHQFSAPWLDQLMRIISWVGFPGGVVVAFAASLWLWWRRLRVASIALLVSFAGSWLLNSWLKLLFGRPRPAIFVPLEIVSDFSFPSGHAMSAICFYGFIAFLLWEQHRRGWALIAVLFALLICFSRIYLGVHYPSDILGAIAVSVLWLLFVILGYRFSNRYYQLRHPVPDLAQPPTPQ